MQAGEAQGSADLLQEITALLADAYQRRARLRLVQSGSVPLPSTKDLDNAAEPSLHEVTLTRRRKEPSRS